MMFSPSFVVKHFRPAGIHAISTLIKVLALQAFGIAAGLAISSYAVLRITDNPLIRRIRSLFALWSAILLGLDLILLLLLAPFLLYDAQRMGYITPIAFNEGYNAYHTSRFLHGGALYLPLTGFPITPVNYPPLSFLLIGALGHLTGSLVLTARSVSFMAMLFVAVLIFWIIHALHRNRTAAALGALLWLTLMARIGDQYVGMFDLQMLGHGFSVGALALYVRWRENLTLSMIGMLAFLCCVGLFIKPLVVAVPITLAIALLWADKRRFGIFAAAGIAVSVAMILGSWLLFGQNFLTNMSLEGHRQWRLSEWVSDVNSVMVAHAGIALLTVLPLFLLKGNKTCPFIYIYVPVSLLTGLYFSGADGTSVNVWFDFFVAAAIAVGFLAGRLPTQTPVQARVTVCGILVASLLPCLAGLKPALDKVLDYDALRQGAQIYRDEVELLRSTPGPALFEIPSSGFDAGKEFLFDPFWGTELIERGRFPESVLTDRIRGGDFSVIALSFDLAEKLKRLDASKVGLLKPTRTLLTRWTDNTLLSISERYQLLDHRYSYLYIPRRH